MEANVKKEVYSWVKAIVLALVVVFICRHFFFSPIAVKGQSMDETLHDQDKLVISKISTIDRFDIIVFHAPDEEEYYVKRVIGLPGDSVEMKDDVLYVNDVAYDEPYVNRNHDEIVYAQITGDFTLQDYTGTATVPEGTYFVLGDNRTNSNDSRSFGVIPADSVIGEVKLRLYPFQDFGIPK